MKTVAAKTLVVALLAAAALTGCGAADKTTTDQNGEKRLRVVTSFYPMYEFSKQVAGDRADVIALVPAGAEPHDWEPKASDMKRIKEADLFVYNGGVVEHWTDQALGSMKREGVAVEASAGMELMEGLPEEGESHDEKELDPHVWLDPVLAQQEVEAIRAGLEKADPAHKDVYKKNADAYIAKLKELDQSFQDALMTVKRKEFVTQHAAFAYLAKRYGLTQVPIAGLSPEEEPSAAKMADIVTFAKNHQVKTIFFETLVEPKVAQTIANEIGAKTAVLNPIEGLTDEERKQNLDYIGVMKNNLASLQTALNE